MNVTNLFLKSGRGKRMRAVKSLAFTPAGLVKGVICQPLRQVLITSLPVSVECGLRAGELRENVVVDYPDLYNLRSGTIVRIGAALIRLTFHCEPCKGVLNKVEFKKILHKRGVLGYFANSGTIRIGDTFAITKYCDEPIPYDIRDRLKWYFQKQQYPVTASKLVYDLGLANSYLRALPTLIKKIPEIDQRLILFKAEYTSKSPSHAHLA